MSSEDYGEEHVMYSRSDDIELVINDKEDEIKEELFQSFFSKYQIGYETSKKGSNSIFYCVKLLQHKCHRINFKSSRSTGQKKK